MRTNKIRGGHLPRVLKVLLDSSSLKYEKLAQLLESLNRQAELLQGSLNSNTRNLFVASKIITCGKMIEELQEDINTLITAINDGKHRINYPQLLTPQMLIDIINELETVNRMRYHLDANPDSYQHIIDISEINVAIIKKSLTYIVDIPVLEKEEYTINHVIPIPQNIQKTHIAIIPDHE